jgi:hypothetical protein
VPRIPARLWRGVEAQYQVATMSLVDSTAEQEVLEELLDAFKPPLPPEAKRVHYLLAAPFRYASPWPSRFRTPDDPGVWYGAQELETACAEVAYWRWRFVQDSEAFDLDGQPVITEHTFYRAEVDGRAVDLLAPPWSSWQKAWMDPGDYSACQALAQEARKAGVAWVRYRSVRDSSHRPCGAVLDPPALRVGNLTDQLSWVSAVRGERVSLTPKALGSRFQSFEYCFGGESG